MTWRVEYDHGTAWVHGPKVEARRRIEACGDHGPIWVERRRAWATSPEVANRVLDQLDGRRQTYHLDHVDQDALDLTETTPANVRAQESLW